MRLEKLSSRDVLIDIRTMTLVQYDYGFNENKHNIIRSNEDFGCTVDTKELLENFVFLGRTERLVK